KCLEKDPARRYATAEELADDLGRFLAGEPVRVRPPSALGRLGRWAKRRKELAYLAAGAAATAPVVTALVALLHKPPVVPQRPPPRIEGVPAEGEDDESFTEFRARSVGRNNLTQLGLGLHNFHDANGGLPPSAIHDKKDGNTLLSWRVLILPYIEQDHLYKE